MGDDEKLAAGPLGLESDGDGNERPIGTLCVRLEARVHLAVLGWAW
jgi:hypothetical protein